MNTTSHLQEWIEFWDPGETPQGACQANSATTVNHLHRVDHGAIAHKLENRIELFGEPFRQVLSFYHDFFHSEGCQLSGPASISSCCKNMGSSVDGEIDSCSAESRGPAAD